MKIRTVDELKEIIDGGSNIKYIFFWGHQDSHGSLTKSCFSQWYPSPFEVEGYLFNTAEHYMMFQKAMLFGDESAAEKILSSKTPGEAKSIGRTVSNFDGDIWVKHRFDIVVGASVAKFSTYPSLKEFLIRTADRVLVEASPVDKIWGVGLAADDPAIQSPSRWKGLNLLGFALMETRERLMKR